MRYKYFLTIILVFLGLFIFGCGQIVNQNGFNDFLTNPPEPKSEEDSNSNPAGSWNIVGQAELTFGEANYPSIAVLNGEPVVAFQDVPYGKKLTVMKYNSSNNSWAALGTAGISDGEVTDIVLKIKGLDIYVAFKDIANNNSITVMKYSGGSWSVVGSKGFTTSLVNSFDMEINNNGEIVIACHFGDLKLYSWNGNTWSLLTNTALSPAYYISLKFDSSNVPYVGFTINSSTSRVMRYKDTAWQTISPDPYTDAYPKTKLVLKNDCPLVLIGQSYSYLISRIFTGTSWQSINDNLVSIALKHDNYAYLTTIRAFDVFSTGSMVYTIGSFSSPSTSTAYPNGVYVLVNENNSWSVLGNKICEISRDYALSVVAAGGNVWVVISETSGTKKLSVYKYTL